MDVFFHWNKIPFSLLKQGDIQGSGVTALEPLQLLPIPSYAIVGG
jgi:hypothetical protein